MTTPVVLDEDTYTEAISLIIERDFFPNLAKLRAQQDYLEAQRNGTFTDLQEAGKALRQVDANPLKTKRDGQQSINFYVENEPRIEKRVNLNLSLDQFQTLYTSEDNASFTDLLEKANVKIKEQNKWFFDRESKQLRLTDRPHESSPVQLIEAGNQSTLGWKYQARNSLMYFPQGKSESWVNQNEGRGQPKSIEYHNTHILTEQTVKKNPNPTTDQGSLMAWNQLNGLQRDNDNPSSTPKIRGFSLVDATPTLSPTRMGTPEMTWGSIEGTPLLISNNNGSKTPGYSLPKISKREELGMKLSEKASKAYRKKTNERQRAIQGTPRSG
ncbi:DiGeorge syndrome critical region protein 14 [Rhizopus stolonifer]|uniref:DiGeorge syndrome critical region protein 14 n=2 Tax=Mucorineae TaxID=1344963 RepID=A0A367KK85_RHIST|nr:DiGeorge syndrome critical region protein 14 [Rhizopus stolonifer]